MSPQLLGTALNNFKPTVQSPRLSCSFAACRLPRLAPLPLQTLAAGSTRTAMLTATASPVELCLRLFFSVIMGSIALGQLAPPLTAFLAATAAVYPMLQVIHRKPLIDGMSEDGTHHGKSEG